MKEGFGSHPLMTPSINISIGQLISNEKRNNSKSNYGKKFFFFYDRILEGFCAILFLICWVSPNI